MIVRSTRHRPSLVPGAPTGVSQVGSSTTNSISVTWSPPTTGGALDQGTYTLQYATHGGSFSTYATVQYCTPDSGSITDRFGNVWAISTAAAAAASEPGAGLTINGNYISPTNNVTLMYLVSGAIWQFGSNAWYSFTPTQNYGATPPAGSAFAGPVSTSPLVITVSGLAAITSYDFKVEVSNSSGQGPFSLVLTATTAAVSSPVIWGGFFDQSQQSTNIVSTSNNLISSNWAAAGGSGAAPVFRTCETYAYNYGPDFSYNGNWQSNLSSWQVPQQNAVLNAASGGVPMLAVGPSLSPGGTDQTMIDMINGLYDPKVDQLCAAYASAGYTKMFVRWLWEFNIGGGMGNTTQAHYVGAYQRLVTRSRNTATNSGMTVYSVWNPGSGNGGPASWYPGNAYVDVIALDQAAGWGGQGNYTSNPMDTSVADYQVGGCATFAAQNGKPMGMCETACSAISINDAYNFNSRTSLSSSISATQTSITVGSNSLFNVGDTLGIGYEWLQITSISGNTIGVTRGYLGTVAASHSSGAFVAHGGYTQWCASCLTVILNAGAKVALWSWYDATDASGGGDAQAYELWQSNATDTAAVVNFQRLCPAQGLV